MYYSLFIVLSSSCKFKKRKYRKVFHNFVFKVRGRTCNQKKSKNSMKKFVFRAIQSGKKIHLDTNFLLLRFESFQSDEDSSRGLPGCDAV